MTWSYHFFFPVNIFILFVNFLCIFTRRFSTIIFCHYSDYDFLFLRVIHCLVSFVGLCQWWEICAISVCCGNSVFCVHFHDMKICVNFLLSGPSLCISILSHPVEFLLRNQLLVWLGILWREAVVFPMLILASLFYYLSVLL